MDDSTMFPTEPAGVSYADNPAFCTPLPGFRPEASSAEPQQAPPPPPDWLGKRSGFPENFNGVCQTIFRQMFRVYPHLYWSHFEDTYHLGLEKALNSCFSHFVLTATTLNLLAAEDLVPMQALVDFSAAIGTVPPGSRAHEYARVEVGQLLMQKAGYNPAAA